MAAQEARNIVGYVRQVAKIEKTSLGYEDHGIFTAWAYVTYGFASQGIGGYALSAYDKNSKEQVGTRYGMEWIIRFLRACGVDSWEKLQGRTVYALFADPGAHGLVVGIEPLETEPGESFIFADIKDLAVEENL